MTWRIFLNLFDKAYTFVYYVFFYSNFSHVLCCGIYFIVKRQYLPRQIRNQYDPLYPTLCVSNIIKIKSKKCTLGMIEKSPIINYIHANICFIFTPFYERVLTLLLPARSAKLKIEEKISNFILQNGKKKPARLENTGQ